MEFKCMYINGDWVKSENNNTRTIINPSNQEKIAEASEGDEQDAKKAIQAARKAFEQGDWADKPANERGEIVYNIGKLIQRDREELARMETLDSGKTLEESRVDMDDIASVFLYFGELADKDGGEVIESPIPDSDSRVNREPVGVCGQITPWNYPLLQASWKLAPALAAGNTLVLKPSEITPLTSVKVFELMEEAGVPKGVANLVLGSGDTVGAELSNSTDIDLISFTGGVETGKKIIQGASNNIKNIALELGGKNPNIVFGDADFELAVDQAMNAVYFHAGQVCSAGARLLVEENIYDDFINELIRRVKQIKVGDGFKEDTEMGPLISKEHLEKVENYVEIGKQEGAEVLVGGNRPDDPELQDGFFYLPTVVTNCSSDMKIIQEEVFGPVLTVETFKTEDEAINKANDTIYGLAGGVFSQDIAKAERVAKDLRIGTIWINDFHPYFAQAPWGGYKQSGIGRELGRPGLDEYTEVKHIFRNTNPEPVGWFPS